MLSRQKVRVSVLLRDAAVRVEQKLQLLSKASSHCALFPDFCLENFVQSVDAEFLEWQKPNPYEFEAFNPLHACRVQLRTDPVHWRKAVGSEKFPNLALVAEHYLTVVYSSAGTERLFSAYGSVQSAVRSRLSPRIAERLVQGLFNMGYLDRQSVLCSYRVRIAQGMEKLLKTVDIFAAVVSDSERDIEDTLDKQSTVHITTTKAGGEASDDAVWLEEEEEECDQGSPPDGSNSVDHDLDGILPSCPSSKQGSSTLPASALQPEMKRQKALAYQASAGGAESNERQVGESEEQHRNRLLSRFPVNQWEEE